VYIRISISVQSWESTPPAPGLIEMRALVGCVGVGEEQLELLGAKLAGDLVRLPRQLQGQLGILHRRQLDEVPGARLELLPLIALGTKG